MNAPDLRPHITRAQAWIATLIDGVTPADLDLPTPCVDFNVRDLLQHLFAVEKRVESVGLIGTIADAPTSLPLPSGDLGAGFRIAAAAAIAPWNDDRLTSMVTVPFGTLPGAAALGAYLSEHIAHGWDLAVATGQPSETDEDIAMIALQAMTNALPAEPRGGDIPFGAPVDPAVGAGPTERLANWTGRSR
ncbi:MAG: TIGR03086 family metal-binding protein [Cumulibacter sp.]